MLFNSYAFVFLFLPLALAGFYLLARRDQRVAAGWLAAGSLIFYGYWDLAYIPLLCASILFNYAIGRSIASAAAAAQPGRCRALLTFGVVADLALLGYFKYANFFVASLDDGLGLHLPLPHIVLPVGISFFTFTQIAYLVDASRGIAREYSLTHYTLFVSYFPHLIAGPILHHKEMIPQFRDAASYQVRYDNLAKGAAFFALGLFKKVVLADGIAVYVAPVFDAAGPGGSLTFIEAWGGALAYTLQLYFDFSGYSDMAVGLSWLFNVRLPFNFDSPYKAANIIDFWRRWHMTLSRFLRDYLYFPLGGNRRGPIRRYLNLLLTMVLGGLWHGASWNFVFWGALHGSYLMLNHGWHAVLDVLGLRRFTGRWWTRASAQLLTLLAVVIAWVFFRATSVESALNMVTTMSGANGIVLPDGAARLVPDALQSALHGWGVQFGDVGATFRGAQQVLLTVALFAVCLLAPNSQEWIEARMTDEPGRAAALRWSPSVVWAVLLGLATAWCVLQFGKVSEFLYFQF